MIAYLNGEFVPLQQATLPVWDYGFTMGVTLTEQLRTYGGAVPLLSFSLDRLFQGLDRLKLQLPETREQLGELVRQVVNQNRNSVAGETVELSIGIAVTPGAHLARSPIRAGDLQGSGGVLPLRPTLLIYALPLSFEWGERYTEGVLLQTVSIREISGHSIPRQLKTRSRIHYYLAEQEAQSLQPGSFALLQQADGTVVEGTTSSLLVVEGGSLLAPPVADVLPSLSVRFVEEILAPKLGIPFHRAPLTLDRINQASELLWLSTPFAILPVRGVNGREIGDGEIGDGEIGDGEIGDGEIGDGEIGVESAKARWPMFQKLIAAWSGEVGVDIIGQAQQD